MRRIRENIETIDLRQRQHVDFILTDIKWKNTKLIMNTHCCSELDVEESGSLLDNSAAKHKMAIRPRKRHSESHHSSPSGRLGGDDSSSNATDADDGVKKSRADELHAPRQQIYQRSRSGRLASIDPHAKRE